MKESLWARFGFWLEQFPLLDPLVFKRLSIRGNSHNAIYENRLNRHIVVKRGKVGAR